MDAPVSGGEVGAKAASLTIMVRRRRSAPSGAVKPFSDKMGKNVTLVGAVGDGQSHARWPTRSSWRSTSRRWARRWLFASKAGADPAKVRQALMGGFASSRILEVHGERMIKRTFGPGFRIALHQKDLNLAMQGACPGRGAAADGDCRAIDERLRGAGVRAGDHSALVRALEALAQHLWRPTPGSAHR